MIVDTSGGWLYIIGMTVINPKPTETPKPIMRVTNLKDVNEHSYVKMLISGQSGAGKTSLLGTLPGKTLVISGESGTMPLEGRDIDIVDLSISDTVKGDDGKPMVLRDAAKRIAKFRATFDWLHAGAPDAKGKPSGYLNVCLDSLTEISETFVEDLNRQFPDRKDSFPMWGEYSKIMRSIVKNLRDLPYNVIITVLSKQEKDDIGKRYMGFDVAGSISDRLPQYFDEVFYLHVDNEGKRSIITRKTDTLICKDRSNKLLPQEDADLGEIMRKIMLRKEEGK